MTTKNQFLQPTNGQFLIYQSKYGKLKIDVRFDGDTIWLTQDQLVHLFQSGKANVSKHIKHIFGEGKLSEEAVVQKLRTISSYGRNYNKKFYNLDMIISVGYRIKSQTATRFRQWATECLREFIVKDFILNKDWIEELDGFLTLSRRDVFQDAGKISHDLAIEHANAEYQNFKQLRLAEQNKLPSKFDKLLVRRRRK